jgi:hypothetical protein
MSTIRGNKNFPVADVQRSTMLNALMHRWHEALGEIRDSLLSGERRKRIVARRRDRRAPECAAEGQLTEVADDNPEPIRADPRISEGDTRARELGPLSDQRSQALAVLCNRLLEGLDGAEMKSAEIRFVVHKHEQPGYPRLDPGAPAGAGDGELVSELRRLIAWSGGTIADVARALETRGADLDENGRELLRDEIAALDVDLATLNVHLADPVDWDSEFEWLLAGEVGAFDDFAGDEEDENDD